MGRTVVVAALAALALAGCQTTEDAAVGMQSAWLGQPVDSFLVRHGPPRSSYELGDGGTIYTWRGGEITYTKPARVETRQTGPTTPLASTTRTRTTTSNPSPGTTVTRTTTRSASVNFTPQTTTVVTPARTVNLYCEAQITADPSGTITNIRISRDTEGRNLSLSRCADLFAERD